MKYTQVENLNKTVVSQIIEAAWALEASRDIEGSIDNFAPVWSNIERDPDFSDFELSQQAVLYRLTGFFLSICGIARNVKNYQERAKDLIFKSIDCFSLLEDKYGKADAENVLAVCYFNEGAILEAEAILEQTAERFTNDVLHPVYLRNRVNYLLAKQKQRHFQEAVKIIEELLIPFEFCDDFRTCALFHEKAGLIYRGLKLYDKAIWHYNESIRFSYQINNLLFVSSQRNNLAFLFTKIKNFELAHYNINEAIRLAHENNFIGWIPNYLDTKALIFANEGCHEVALKVIDEAISMFQSGDDYFGLTESIWNKCRFLLKLDRKEEAILLFSEMIPIASQRMGEFAVKGFIKEFSDLIHVKQESSLEDELKRFKRNEIVNAILLAEYDLSKAAESLKLNLNVLVKILDREFPELYSELDIQPLKEVDEAANNERQQPSFNAPRNISQLNLQNVEISFANNSPNNFLTFYISRDRLSDSLNINQDIIVTVTQNNNIKVNDFVIALNKSRNIYLFGQLQYDEGLNLYYLLEKGEEIPVFLDDVEVIGTVFGYCNFAEINQDKLHFLPIDF